MGLGGSGVVLELVLEPELELGVELVPVLELGSVPELVLASEPGFELESALELVLELELVPEALEAVPEAVELVSLPPPQPQTVAANRRVARDTLRIDFTRLIVFPPLLL